MKIKRMTFLRTSCSTPFAIWRQQKKGVASDRAQTNSLFLIAMTRLQILVSQWIGILICVSMCSCDIHNYHINTSEPEEGSGLILKVGHDFSVSCNVTSVPEEENLPVVWFKDGYQLNATDNIQINNNSIYIKTTVIGDTGEYTCAVNLPNLNLSKSIMVRSQPRLKELGKSKNHVQGDKMTLKCESEGNPIPKLTWFLNDKNLSDPNHADERIEITFDEEKGIAELTIKELEENDRADYMCIAENVVGSANITILVRVKDKLAALWPFLGIVAEVAVLCTIIFIYEKRRAKQEYDESDTDQSPDTKNVSENKDKDVRQRK